MSRASRGTLAAPAAVQTGDELGWHGFQGYDGTGFFPNTTVTGMVSVATEDWNNAAHGSSLNFFSTANGDIASTQRMKISEDGASESGPRRRIPLLMLLPKIQIGRAELSLQRFIPEPEQVHFLAVLFWREAHGERRLFLALF